MTPVDVGDGPPAPEARSYRIKPDRSSRRGPERPAPDESDGFDPIGSALEAPAARPAAAPGYAELPPAFEPSETEGARGGSRGANRQPALVGYRDPAADPEPASAPAPAPASDPVPRGTLIQVVLLTAVDTGNPAAVLQFAAARGLVFGHRLRLPFGTRFLGRLSGPPARDRLNLAVDTVLYPDGLELPIRASAVEADDSGASLRPGVAADFVPPPAWVRAAPYVSGAVTGYLGLLEAQAERPVGIGIGGLTLSSPGARAPLDQAAADAVRDFTQAQLKELGDRYAGHFLIPAGTVFWLQLDADLVLGAAAGRAAPPRPLP
jgi:hypothetical protein